MTKPRHGTRLVKVFSEDSEVFRKWERKKVDVVWGNELSLLVYVS